MNSTSDDGWNLNEPIDTILAAYSKIDEDISQNPIETTVKEVEDPHEPKRIISDKEEQVVYFLPDSDSDDDGVATNRKPTFFRPPLQVQRNTFVRNTLKNCVHNGFKLKKMAVLGCGESSLERFLCHEFGMLGIERVISVDFDEHALARGIRLLRNHLLDNDDSIRGAVRLPCLIEHYLGDILKYDERLAQTDCVCSTEVIEHITLEEAEIFVRLVLDIIRPKVFIVSTPNHEYNKAFGMEPGLFRHDDHKYEFTRAEFIEWVEKILKGSGSGYKHKINYVGNMSGFHELQGATQFVVFFRSGETDPEPHSHEKTFKKAAQTIACGGLNSILIKRSKVALTSWFRNNKLDSTNLIVTSVKYWKIPLDQIIKLMDVPNSVVDNIHRKRMIDMLKAITRSRLFAEYGGPEAEDSAHYLIVPEDCSIKNVLASISV